MDAGIPTSRLLDIKSQLREGTRFILLRDAYSDYADGNYPSTAIIKATSTLKLNGFHFKVTNDERRRILKMAHND